MKQQLVAPEMVRPENYHVSQAEALYVDLFCGGGGSTSGALRAFVELGLGEPGKKVRVVAVNHDEQALATHAANHPKVTHINCDIERLDPYTVLYGQQITVLWASAPCQDWSVAAGGPCTRPQKRATPAYILNWIRIGRPQVYVEENVFEITTKWPGWEQHLQEIRDLGYNVQFRRLDAADYGVPQNRKRLILIARRDNGAITWPRQSHSNPAKPVAGTEPWRGAITALDLDTPCPSIFGRKDKNGNKKLHSPKTRARIARYIREQGQFWEPLAKAVEEGNGPVPFAAALESCPPEQWPKWVEACGDHVHLYAIEPHLTKFYGTGRGQDVHDPSGSVTAQGTHIGVVQPQFQALDPAFMHLTHGGRMHDPKEPSPTVTGANRGEMAAVNFTFGQQGGATPREIEKPAQTVATAGYIRVGELRCLLDTYGSKDTWLARTKDPNRPVGALTCSGRWGVVDVRGIMPPLGKMARGGNANPVRDPERPSSTVLAERGAGHVVEARLSGPAVILPQHGEAEGQLPRIHRGEDPGPTVTTGHTPQVAFLFVYTYNGKANCRDAIMPNTTGTTIERHALYEVRLENLLLDVGMRMLTTRELARLQTFPNDYVFVGNKEDQTRQIGNSVPPDLACAVVKAALSMVGITDTRLGDFTNQATGTEVPG